MFLKALATTACIMVAPFSFATVAIAQSAIGETTEPNYFPTTSEDLLGLIGTCETDDCMSYVSGIIGGISVYAIIAEKPSPFCTRGTVTTENVRDAIISTVETTPALREQHPAVAVLTAFARHWPCVSAEDMKTFQSTPVDLISQTQIDALVAADGRSIVYGDLTADADKTLRVFHDPNCLHCRRFRDELGVLADRGWKIEVYPVATTTEDSAGYGAVEIALRDLAPDAVRLLHEHNPEGVADITLATRLAEEAGVGSRELLTAIAKSGAYTAIEGNTQAFFDMGAEGTPSWIVGNHLFSGFLTADGIESAVENAKIAAPAPSPQSLAPQAQMEQ